MSQLRVLTLKPYPSVVLRDRAAHSLYLTTQGMRYSWGVRELPSLLRRTSVSHSLKLTEVFERQGLKLVKK